MKVATLFRKMRGKGHAPLGRVVRRSNAPVSHSGDTTEVALATIKVPANAMGTNGRILVEGRVSYTNSGNPKTATVKFGGVTYLTGTMTNSKWWRFELKIRNRGSAKSQEGSGFALLSSGALVGAPNAANSSAVDTSESFDITITGQLANPAERISLEVYQVIVYPK